MAYARGGIRLKLNILTLVTHGRDVFDNNVAYQEIQRVLIGR